MTDRARYLAWIEEAFRLDAGNLESEIDAWRAQFGANAANNALFGYYVTKFPLQLSIVAAFLYERNGDQSLARLAADTLRRYPAWTELMPADAAAGRPEYEEGIPPLDAVFDPVVYASACERIRPAVDAETWAALAEIAADSLRPIWRFPEWGGHNRALLRAASLAACGRVFAEHPEAPAWNELADELAEESWGRWSIEDAMLYQAHWLRALILYAEARGRVDELAQQVQPRLHLRAMTQLITPLGILPDFGDSHWLMHSAWEWMACLEWGARTYGDPSMKWAAQRIWAAQQGETPNIYGAQVLSLAWRWCDDSVIPARPGPVHDALDDLVIKKIVFRNGWEGDAAYACINYRDEGDYGWVAREYLRADLAVSAEKMHHGHADEGSVAMLVQDGTILLHESGYREQPPDGIYRADFYHNRLIWRPGLLLGTPQPGALRDNGHYKPVRSERLYLTRLGDAEFARVRVSDADAAIVWDRSIVFLPDLPCWIVLDSALSRRPVGDSSPRTLANLWWTTDILAQGEHWRDTHIRAIQQWPNAQRSALRIYTPPVPDQSSTVVTETIRRAFQDEIVIADIWRGRHMAGRSVNFVSVLWPMAYGEQGNPGAGPQIEVIASDPVGQGIGVRLHWQGEERIVGVMNDLTTGYIQEEIRPRRTFAQGKTTYGDITSDAAFVYSRRRAAEEWHGFINGTGYGAAGKTLYDGGQQAMFQEDRTARVGVPTRFRWERRFQGGINGGFQ